MDTSNLWEFINYKPIWDEDPQFLVDQIIKEAGEYLDPGKLDKIQKAYEFAKKAHAWILRQSWEHYIVHPVQATLFLLKIKPDLATIQACLLHDVIEDTPFTYNDIKAAFGMDVANLCTGLEKVSKVKYHGEERQVETLKKMFLAMWKDLRVIFIKLADRIHNIQTLEYHPKAEKRKRIAEETLMIYAPIAQRLWLWIFQGYLENGSFKILQKKDFTRIFTYLRKKYWDSNGYIESGKEQLDGILGKYNIEFECKGRIKSPYRIYSKLQKYNTQEISKVLDVLAYRVITKDVGDCYNILWYIHAQYTPIIKKIKDYIALPKSNGYMSLHTTILWMFDFPVEIQIRTKEMDEIAEYGIAAHYAYSEHWKSVAVSNPQAQWIKKLHDLVKNYNEEFDEGSDFKNILNLEVLEKNIFVYSPTGDIVELPSWWTVLDYAFKIHTDLGLMFRHAMVNERIVPIDYILKTWEIVHIERYKNRYSATKSWLDILHIPSSKAKLTRFLRQKERKSLIDRWFNLLNEELEKLNLPTLFSKNDSFHKEYKEEELENIYVHIATQEQFAYKYIKNVYEEHFKSIYLENLHEQHLRAKIPVVPKAKAIIDIDKHLSYNVCPECKPQPGDKIIAKVGKTGIKIHAISCKALEVISYDKLLEAHWDGEKENTYFYKLKLKLLDQPWILLSILNAINELNINLKQISLGQEEDGFREVNIDVELTTPSKIQYVIKELKNKNNLVKITSIQIY